MIITGGSSFAKSKSIGEIAERQAHQYIEVTLENGLLVHSLILFILPSKQCFIPILMLLAAKSAGRDVLFVVDDDAFFDGLLALLESVVPFAVFIACKHVVHVVQSRHLAVSYVFLDSVPPCQLAKGG